MSLERLYEVLRKIDSKVDEIYKLRDSSDAEIAKLISEVKVKVEDEIEEYIKRLIGEYKEKKHSEIENEVNKYSEICVEMSSNSGRRLIMPLIKRLMRLLGC